MIQLINVLHQNYIHNTGPYNFLEPTFVLLFLGTVRAYNQVVQPAYAVCWLPEWLLRDEALAGNCYGDVSLVEVGVTSAQAQDYDQQYVWHQVTVHRNNT